MFSSSPQKVAPLLEFLSNGTSIVLLDSMESVIVIELWILEIRYQCRVLPSEGKNLNYFQEDEPMALIPCQND